MATKDDKPGLEKSGYEEGGSSSRIRITLTSQEVAPLEKGAPRPMHVRAQHRT